MPLLPLIGHAGVRQRISDAIARGSLPNSLLLQGRRGVGKQRLALWMAQALVCTGEAPPCGLCQGCRYATALTHPDIYWFFPVPRADVSDSSPEEVVSHMRGQMRDRAAAGGLWPPSVGSDGIFVEMIRALVRTAVGTPSMARRKIMILGDADRMIAQEGSDQAANALLKLLEEPLPDTVLILTSSEPGALLPTIRSRVVSVRVAPLQPGEMTEWRALDGVQARTGAITAAALDRAAGAPGELLAGSTWEAAGKHARDWLISLDADAAGRFETVLSEKATGARGAFADVLDALEVILHERLAPAIEHGGQGAVALAKAQDAVEAARERTGHNVNPALITAELLRDLRALGIRA